MALWQEWWAWVAVGVLLAVLEVVAPAYVFLGFSIGVILTGLLILVGVVGGSLPPLILIAAVLSLVSWLVLRRIFGVRHGQVKIWDRDINDEP